LSAKTDFIIQKYPQLVGHDDFISVVLDIRATFKLEAVPFSISVGDWRSGSLERFYGAERNKIIEAELKAKKKERKQDGHKRRGSPGWVRY